MKDNLSRAYVAQFCSLGHRAPVAYEFLHKHGQCMAVSPDNAAFEGRGPMGGCYRNSSRTAFIEGLVYCEGFAVPAGLGIPLEHAWVCDLQGRVIDPTWPDGSDYFGVPFTEDFHSEITAETGYHGILCNLYRLRTYHGSRELLAYLSGGVAQPDYMQQIAA